VIFHANNKESVQIIHRKKIRLVCILMSILPINIKIEKEIIYWKRKIKSVCTIRKDNTLVNRLIPIISYKLKRMQNPYTQEQVEDTHYV